MFASILLIAIFVVILWFLKGLKKKKKSFNYRVLTALIIGLLFGLIVQLGFGTAQTQIVDTDGAVVSDYVTSTEAADGSASMKDAEGNTIPMLISFNDLELDDTQLAKSFGEEALKYDGVLIATKDD